MNSNVNLIRVFRNTTLGKILSIGIALYIFNISIDSVDATTLTGKEDLITNDIESFAELIVEEMANCEDFFQEFDDQETESTVQKTAVACFGIIVPTFTLAPIVSEDEQPTGKTYVAIAYNTFFTITSPPPEIV
jgi:hypothetical protein